MEIEDQSGLNLKLNEKNHVASVIKSPKAVGSVFIPRLIQHNGNDYKIISIDNEAFSSNKIESITFPQDSEVESFKKDAFQQTSIKKLQIPPKLKTIEPGCFFLVTDLVEIEVSPTNKNFQYFDNKYLLGKSNSKNDIFDLLIYGRFDIEEAEIPSFVKVLKRHSFGIHLKSLIFPEDSQIESIEFGVINKSFKKLSIPCSLKKIDQNCFQTANNITEIEVSPKNEIFCYKDNKYLLVKSSKTSKIFDQIIFCRRDVIEATIPNYIKKIDAYSFSRCNQLKTVSFQDDSKVETIDNYAFSDSSLLESIVIPSSTKTIGSSAFYNMTNLSSVQVLAIDVTVEDCCFSLCNKLKSVSFPNATSIFIDGPIPEGTKVMVKKEANLTGDLTENNSGCIEHIDESVKDVEAVILPEEEEKNEVVDESELRIISMPMKKFNEIVEHVRFLEKNLNKFEDIEEFDFDAIIAEFTKKDDKIKEEEEEVKEKENENKPDVVEEEEVQDGDAKENKKEEEEVKEKDKENEKEKEGK